MPILRSTVTQRISQEEFKSLATHVMSHVFAVRNEFGGFFDEMIYKKELAQRIDCVVLEVPTTLTHGSFSKTHFSDMLVKSSALFEFKLVDALHPRHRGQTLNYLLLHRTPF
jgi:GxxExxY protein